MVMTIDRWQQVEKIFHSALERAPGERPAYIEAACAGDLSLRRDVESLISSDERANSFLNTLPSPANPIRRLADLVGCLLDEKYRIERQLGVGGMGSVFLATHLGTGRPVAVKVIAPQYMQNEEFVERFKREAKAAGLLRHPNVVNVTDFGFAHVKSDRVAYLVMEYLDGLTLGAMLKERRQLPLALAVDIVEQICLAIEEAHKQGIIHRDLKPENIWLEPNGRGGYNVKVLDFGLAKLRDVTSLGERARTDAERPSPTPINNSSEAEVTRVNNDNVTAGALDAVTIPEWLTRVGAVMGTPLYMSPEQCHGKELDARADIYSLGVVAYQILCGETPFSGDLYQLIDKHTNMPPPSLRARRRDLPKPIADLVMSALAKAPVDRPVSAATFAISLRTIMDGEQAIFNDAQELYKKNRALFLRIGFIIYLPAIFMSLSLPMTISYTTLLNYPHLVVATVLFQFLIIQVANRFHTAAGALVIERLSASPSTAIRPQLLLSQLFKCSPRLLATMALNSIQIFIRLPLLIVPALRTTLNHSLAIPITILENGRGQQALARSQSLVAGLRSIAVALHIHRTLSITVSLLIFIFGYFYTTLVIFTHLDHPAVKIALLIYALIFLTLVGLDFTPHAIAQNLLYYKARQMRGEPLTLKLDLRAPEMPSQALFITKRALYFLGIAANRAFLLIIFTLFIYAVLANTMGIRRQERTDFINAVRLAQVNNVRAFIANGYDVNMRFENGMTPLTMAADSGQVQIVQMLLAAGGEIRMTDASGHSPLYYAAQQGRTDVVKILLKAGADTERQNVYGMTALMSAARYGRVECVQALVAAGADINAKDKTGKTALAHAVEQGQLEVVRILKAALATPETP